MCGISDHVSPPTAPAGVSLLLGRDHEAYGAHERVSISAHTAATISPGSDVEFLRQSTAKYDVNEDALLVFEDGRHTVLCVADAHFGKASSEDLICALANALLPVPQNPHELDDVLRDLADRRPASRDTSETTLLICIYDRMFKQAFGVSFGDSSLVHVVGAGVDGVDGASSAELMNEKTTGFVSLSNPDSLHPDDARHFAFSPRAGDLLIAYSDGIDECCYRDPDRSISLDLLAETVRTCGGAPIEVAQALTQLALAGVNGHPGGQDNLVLALTRA